MKYVVVWNMPGYLPEAEPVECETIREAMDVLGGELDRSADYEMGEDEGDAWDDAIYKARAAWGEVTVHAPDGLVYEILEAEG